MQFSFCSGFCYNTIEKESVCACECVVCMCFRRSDWCTRKCERSVCCHIAFLTTKTQKGDKGTAHHHSGGLVGVVLVLWWYLNSSYHICGWHFLFIRMTLYIYIFFYIEEFMMLVLTESGMCEKTCLWID